MKQNKAVFDREVLKTFGARERDMGLLLEYVANPMQPSSMPAGLSLPLEDEPFVETWNKYAQEAEKSGFLQALRNRLMQLDFPVQEDMSQDPEYQAAVKKGQIPEEPGPGPLFVAPEQLRVFVHESPAGAIGVLLAGERQDFVTLVQALLHKNEPAPVPDSLGAFMVSGYNNWDRIKSYRQQWMEEQNNAGDDFSWMLEFEQLKRKKELYQDRFIILSSGPYSDIPAADLGLEPEVWREKSVSLRLEHECTHYFTRRVFSSMRKNIWDEILGDYMGIRAARGSYSAEWFLKFLGLERHPDYRPGGRFVKYLPGDISPEAFKVVQEMTWKAAWNLEALDHEFLGNAGRPDPTGILLAFCSLCFSHLACPKHREYFQQELKRVQQFIDI